MNLENDKLFYIDFNTVKRIYPGQISVIAKDCGVLEEYRNNKYTLEEINNIIAKLITRVPYIKGSMDIRMSIMGKNLGYHHILTFKNYEYKNQERMTSSKIEFLY